MTVSRPTRLAAALLVMSLVVVAAPARATDAVTFKDPKGDVKVASKGATKTMKRSVDITAVTLSSTESTALLRVQLDDIAPPKSRNKVTFTFTAKSPGGKTTVTGAVKNGTTTCTLVTAKGKKRSAVLTWSDDSNEVVVATPKKNFPAGKLSVRLATGYSTPRGVTARDAHGNMPIALR